MANKSFLELFTIFALVGIFVFAIISFSYNLQVNNGVEDTILGNGILNKTYSNLNSDLTDFREKSQGQKTNFEEGGLSISFGSLVLTTIGSIGKVFNGMILGVFGVLIILPAQILGVSSLVVGVLEAILLLTIMLSLWRVYRSGS